MFATSLLLTPSSNAQTNSWTSATSGNWEDTNSWSLGQLPGSGQTILLTNAGFKAVQIRQNTAAKFSQTLAVDSLTISSPTNSLNTLLMNFVGVDSPLVVNSLTVDANSGFTMHSSALLVQSTSRSAARSIKTIFPASLPRICKSAISVPRNTP